jgi:hypothetical protein
VRLQEEGESPEGVPVDWHPEGNILMTFPDVTACNVGISPTWTISGWKHTFVQLAPGAKFEPPAVAADEQQAVKIIRGTLLDVGVNGILRDDNRWETYVVTPPNRAASLFVGNEVDAFEAGDEGAAFVYFKIPKAILNTPITDMTTAPATTIDGPFADALQWVQFGSYFADFENVLFFNMAGIGLYENDGSRLGYFQWWTMREDEDADGYHDHGNLTPEDAFSELHMALYSASGVSGMQSTMPGTRNLRFQDNPNNVPADDAHKYNQNDQTEVQLSIPMPPGHIHGPLWSVNEETGEPMLQCNGGVQYPFHRWLIGAGEGRDGYHSPPRYSMWMAFEIPPQYATVPQTMLAHWPNAMLQSVMDAPDCENN